MSITRLTSGLETVRDDVRAAIGTAAQKTGVAFSYLLAQAKSESGLNPTARASGSSATGLYQFLDQSWLAVVKRHGSEHGYGWAADAITARAGGGYHVAPEYRQAVMALRQQPGPAALMAASYASDNASSLSQSLGRQANATDLYMAHFLGLGGATKFLAAAQTAPGATAAALFPREAAANRSIFYDRGGAPRTLSDVYQVMAGKLNNAGGNDDAIGAPGQLADAGALVSEPPTTGTEGFRLAVDDSVAGDASGSTDIAATLAALERNRIDVLRPTPAQAKLAYLMLSAPMA